MTAHKHAALMVEYAKDAAETDKPWERWECLPASGLPFALYKHPDWDVSLTYRRKRVPLCQVEGRDVFVGDLLWNTARKAWVTIINKTPSTYLSSSVGEEWPGDLSWTEPPRTKTVYQWAWRRVDGQWTSTRNYYATADELRVEDAASCVRLDYTALEVPCDD